MYDEAEVNFDTDYDRENPVTKVKALKKWKELAEKRKKPVEHQYHHQVEYDEQKEGYQRFFE